MKHIFSQKFYVLTLLVLLVLPAGGGLGAEEFLAAVVGVPLLSPGESSPDRRDCWCFSGNATARRSDTAHLRLSGAGRPVECVLLSPSFHEGEYWEPAKGFRKQLQQRCASGAAGEAPVYAINFYGLPAADSARGGSPSGAGAGGELGAHGCGYFPGGPPPANPHRRYQLRPA